MRWTSFFSPTLRDAPADAEAPSHKLLVRGGFIRQLHSGHYTLLPLAFRVRKKIIKIIEEEMDAIGGQEVQMPTLQPSAIWKESGRWESMGDIMFRLEDRHGGKAALGVTAEEFLQRSLARSVHTNSYPKCGIKSIQNFVMSQDRKADYFESEIHHERCVLI